jgi:hypothetical protein
MGWVFGKRQDLMIFTGPVAGAFLLNYLTPHFALDIGFLILIAQIFFNLPHAYISYWHAYGYEASRRQNVLWLGFIPVFFVVLNSLFYQFFGREMVSVFLVNFSAWHFLKQQQAWFHISMRKESYSKIGRWINKNGIFAVTSGFFFASLSEGHHRGWYREFDLLQIPAAFYSPLLYWVYASAAVYTGFHLLSWKKNKRTNWAGHHMILAGGLCWWLIRIAPESIGGGLLLPLHHSIPYLFIGYRYMKTGDVHIGRSKLILPVVIYLGALAVGYGDLLARSLPVEGSLTHQIAIILTASFAYTHFTFDMFLWNRNHNPGWTRVLFAGNDVKSVATKEEITTIAA